MRRIAIPVAMLLLAACTHAQRPAAHMDDLMTERTIRIASTTCRCTTKTRAGWCGGSNSATRRHGGSRRCAGRGRTSCC